jgi:uncharacterized phiE125 gp8 family phage protein
VVDYCHPVSKSVRSTEPTFVQEPVTLAEAKRQCGLSDGVNQYDEMLHGFIIGARQQVEHDTGVVCYTGTHTFKMTDWPDEDWFEIPDVWPVTSVTSIVYIAGDGTSTTWSSANYSLDTSAVKPFVKLAYAGSWPAVRGDINGITVTFVAGYATVPTVPQKVKQAVLLATHMKWLEHREMDTKHHQLAYDRQIGLLQRGVYP